MLSASKGYRRQVQSPSWACCRRRRSPEPQQGLASQLGEIPPGHTRPGAAGRAARGVPAGELTLLMFHKIKSPSPSTGAHGEVFCSFPLSPLFGAVFLLLLLDLILPGSGEPSWGGCRTWRTVAILSRPWRAAGQPAPLSSSPSLFYPKIIFPGERSDYPPGFLSYTA